MTVGRDPVFYVKVHLAGAYGGGVVDVTERVEDFTYDDNEAKVDTLKLSVRNDDCTQYDANVWAHGNEIEVSWGYVGDMGPARLCVINKTSGGLKMTIEANDRGCLLNKEKRVRTFGPQIKRSDVARTLAEEHGYGPDQQFIEDTEVVLEQVTQARMTDGELLRDMAKREGFELFVDFDGFHFHRRFLDQSPAYELTYYVGGKDVRGEGVITGWNVENDIYAKKAGAVDAKAVDPTKKSPIDLLVGNVDAKKGASLADEKLIISGISQKDGSATGDKIKGTGSKHLERSTEASAAAAKRAALGALLKNQLTAALLTVDAVGIPRFLAKGVVKISGIGKTLSGNYYITQVTHKVGAKGYDMQVKCRRDGRSKGLVSGVMVPPGNPTNNKPAAKQGKPGAEGSGGHGAKEPPLVLKIDTRSGEGKYVEGAGRETGTKAKKK